MKTTKEVKIRNVDVRTVLSLAIVVWLVFALLGCSTVPKVVNTSSRAGYRYSQDPERRTLKYRGPDYKEHLKEVQAENLRNERSRGN